MYTRLPTQRGSCECTGEHGPEREGVWETAGRTIRIIVAKMIAGTVEIQ